MPIVSVNWVFCFSALFVVLFRTAPGWFGVLCYCVCLLLCFRQNLSCGGSLCLSGAPVLDYDSELPQVFLFNISRICLFIVFTVKMALFEFFFLWIFLVDFSLFFKTLLHFFHNLLRLLLEKDEWAACSSKDISLGKLNFIQPALLFLGKRTEKKRKSIAN